MGGKIWFTAIAGLLLGFVLFGMIQRGCEAQGDSTVATTASPDEPISRQFNSATRSNERTIDRGSGANSNARSAKGRRNGPRNSASRRSGRTTNTTPSLNRKEALERSEAARTRADAARRAELARLTRERTEKYRQRSRAARADDPNTLDPALRATTVGATPDDQVALAAAEAGNELRNLRGEGSGSGSGGGGGGAGGDGAGGGGGDGDSRSGDSDSDSGSGDPELDALADLLAGLGIDQSFIDLIQQVVSGAVPPVNPFDPGNSGNNDDDDDTGGGTTDPVDPGDDVDTTTPILARWVDIPQTGCNTLANQGYETRDLYLAYLVKPQGPPVLSSKDDNSLVIVDGSFYQSAFGANGPPSDTGDDCLQFDSYLTIGKAAPVFLTAPDPNNWGQRLTAEWFAIFGAEIAQNPSTFGDNRWYVHVGRFTSKADAKIFGTLRVDGATGVPAFVEVPDWKGADIGDIGDNVPPPAPKVASVSFLSSGVLGGEALQGSVAIDRPAPAGGLYVALTTNKPNRVKLPQGVVIPEGEQSAIFEIRTIASGAVESVTITALTENSQKSATLVLQAPGVSSFEPVVTRLLEGQHTSAIIRLNTPADAGGTKITITNSHPGAVQVPSVAWIPAGQWRTVISITALEVESTVNATIRVAAGGSNRTIQIEVLPSLSTIDSNNDGKIDTADLGGLIAAFGSNNPAFDFNGDGVVDTADLGSLTQHFGETYDPGNTGGGPDDNPDTGGGSDAAVIARWLEVDQGDCDEFPGTRTADLYLGFLNQAPLPVITSDATHGISIANGSFKQHPFGTNNPPAPLAIESFPCLALDTYLSLGGKTPTFLGAPDPANWGSRLSAIWFSITGTFEQDPGKFGDNRRYLHIGRFTADSVATVAGSLRVDYNGELAFVEVPDWATASSVALDLNSDGQVDSTDVAMLTRAMGTSTPEYDFDGDGVVDGDDLRPLLNAIQSADGL